MKTWLIDTLIAVAEARGYRIIWHKGGPKGAWLPDDRTVSIRYGMDDAETLSTLAHELGHAHYGDPPGCHPQHEDRANKFAAKLLIDPLEYATLESIYGPYPSRLAHELGVTVELILTWQTAYERIPQ